MIYTQPGNVFAPGLENRAASQRDRVRAGVREGSITCEELSTLRDMRQEARQGLVEAKTDNGWVGPVERRQVHQDLNHISLAITISETTSTLRTHSAPAKTVRRAQAKSNPKLFSRRRGG